MRARQFWNIKGRLDRPAQILFGQPHFICAKRRSMRFKTVLLVGRTIADVGARQDQRRTPGFGAGGAQRAVDGRDVVAVGNRLDMPAIGFKAARAILGEGEIGCGRQRYIIVVVEVDQLAELEMTGEGCGFRGDALH